MKLGLLVQSLPAVSLRNSIAIFLTLMISAIISNVLVPRHYERETIPDIDKAIPLSFADWKVDKSALLQANLTTDRNELVNQIYDSVVMRTYVNSRNEKVMLAIAYAHEQKQDIKIHRPEVCYVAQGFKMINMSNFNLSPNAQFKTINAKQLIMENADRLEAITYWIRVGNTYPSSGLSARYTILTEGLKNNILDGLLFRVSTVATDTTELDSGFKLQQNFISDLLASMDSTDLTLLIAP